MKKIVFALVICCTVLGMGSFQAKAQDGFFSDARTPGYNQFTLGIQPIIYTDPGTEFMMMFRAAYGIQTDLAFHGKVGVFRDDTYFGGHLEYQLINERINPVSFSLIGGAYAFGEIGLKMSGVLSKNFGQFSFYTGLSFEPIFTVPARGPLLLPLGVDIPASRQVDFIFEADLALNEAGKPYQALHFGLNFYL